MLRDETIRTIRACAPILEENGLTITRRMYDIMFQDEQIRDLFNQSHHGETGSQPRSLAQAVTAYAEHIDQLDQLGPMVERIAQKHVALDIRPEHYPHVGRALLQAIKDVLGEGASEEVMAAWAEGYDFLARILIEREGQLYDAHAHAVGGWTGWRDFVVDHIKPESDIIKSFYLKPADGGPIMTFRPGQYLTFQLDIPNHGRIVRNYSISNAPGKDYYRISIKREAPPRDRPDVPPGVVSNWFHDTAAPGTALRISAPAGDFHLDPNLDTPVVLLSGGVGLTPTISMLDALVEAGARRPAWYIHGTQNGRTHAMKQHVRQIAAAHQTIRPILFYETPRPEDVEGRDYDLAGRITMNWLKQAVPMREADFYFCGPKGFMRMLALGLRALSVPEERIHFEFFGPTEQLYS